jgi:mRNA interferase MazF
VVTCDNIVTVPAETLDRHVGYLLGSQDLELAEAIEAAVDPA